MDGSEEVVGTFGAEKVFGCMGIGADDDGDAEGVHVADGVAGRIVVGMAAFVEATGVDFADAAGFVDELDGFENEGAEPGFVVVEIAVAVVHDDFVEVADYGGTLGFNHAVGLVKKTAKLLSDGKIDKNLNLKVAIMGCAVNGPGEAKEADIGIAGGNGEGLLFKKGEIIKKVKEEELEKELIDYILEIKC